MLVLSREGNAKIAFLSVINFTAYEIYYVLDLSQPFMKENKHTMVEGICL